MTFKSNNTIKLYLFKKLNGEIAELYDHLLIKIELLSASQVIL